MRPETATRLMESVAAGRLTVLCGAGLSMASPSSAPSASAVAAVCAERYQAQVGEALEAGIANDIEQMSLWFQARNRFGDLFINTLVPWEEFIVPHNAGHEAIADFLACGAILLCVTTNYDCLIESAALSLGEPDFQPIVDRSDLARTFSHKPLLKVHGCSVRGPTRLETVWNREQLNVPPIRERNEAYRTWLQAQLYDRDLLIIGFWSDWAYLTDIFATTINAVSPRSVTLVAPSSSEDLEAKAPALWAWANGEGIHFQHERESGANFLEEFRAHFSRVVLRQQFGDCDETHQRLFGTSPAAGTHPLDGENVVRLYALRRDLAGVSRNEPVRIRDARPENRVHTALHLYLMQGGAEYQGHTYSFGGETIRLVNGAGQIMSQVKARYNSEPPLPIPPSRIICIGAMADAAPVNVVRPDEEADIFRGGAAGQWITGEEFLNELVA